MSCVQKFKVQGLLFEHRGVCPHDTRRGRCSVHPIESKVLQLQLVGVVGEPWRATYVPL